MTCSGDKIRMRKRKMEDQTVGVSLKVLEILRISWQMQRKMGSGI